MGGLLRRQRWTAVYFLIGAVAICGLPPLNGFVSEWLVYRAALAAVHGGTHGLALAVLAAPVLALVGGLALACFVKVFGVMFLGSPRSGGPVARAEATRGMLGAMGLLAAGCLAIGLMPAALAPLLREAVIAAAPTGAAGAPVVDVASGLGQAARLSTAGGLLLGLVAALTLWLRRRGRHVAHEAPTWNCGLAVSAPRAQYTASSFADGLVAGVAPGRRMERLASSALFPAPGHMHSHLPDPALDRVLLPAWRLVARVFVRGRALIHNGMTTAYLLYVALTLLVMLILYGGK
jgi:hydrogenase-4 component B